ncbi:MAG: hypothetical protein WBB19_09190 [Desulforhopalus sp.]
MARPLLASTSLALSWMFSPDALTMLANSFGQKGSMFFGSFVIGAIVSVLAISLIHHPTATTSGSSFRDLATETGLLPAMTLTLSSRLCLVVLLPTGMLVTAGFTFNETFIYWFPNFGFSFLLLGLVLALHLTGDHVALAAQSVFIGVTISCLVLLCFAGLFSSQEFQPTPDEQWSTSSVIPLVFTALLLFLGYDRLDSSLLSDGRRYYTWAIGAGCILLTFWGFVSLKNVPSQILADSTIPNVISARTILGQPGRIFMGIIVISGTCGIVNSLFLHASQSLRQMADHVFLPSTGGPAIRRIFCAICFSLAIGAFMAAGLAGSDNLETFIYGTLLLWLLMIGANCFSAVRRLQRQRGTACFSWYLLSAVFPVAAVWLAFIYVHAITLVVFCFLVLAVSATFSAGWLWYDRKIRNKLP